MGADLSANSKVQARLSRNTVLAYVLARLGHKYDLKNISDLARCLSPTPPVPSHLHRRMIALGSGDFTRAICSCLMPQAFQAVRYPILPHVDAASGDAMKRGRSGAQEVPHIRHHSLFAPRDLDIFACFRTARPTIESFFDHRELHWSDLSLPGAGPGRPRKT